MGFIKRRVARQWALVVIVALAASTFAAPTLGAPESPNEVTNWNRIAAETLNAFPAPAGGAPPTAQINMAMTQGAVYDAVNAISGTHQPYLLETQFDAGASKNAAAVTAAYRVLTHITTTVPATIGFPNKAMLLARLDTEHAASLGAIAPSQAKTDGIAAGNAAADAMISARQADGRFGPSQWEPNTDAGHWWPLLRPDGTQILDPTPWAGGVDPFLMTSSAQFRTDGPQSLTSEAWAEDYNEVKSLGRSNSTTRTPEQTHIAIFWQSTPVATWNAVARDLAGSADHGVGVADSARLFAMLNLTAADAAINCWNDKYFWDFWRPWNAIPRGDEDDNPDTRGRHVVDGAHHGPVPRASVWPPVPRWRVPQRPAEILRFGQDRVPGHERPVPRGSPRIRPVLACAQGNHRRAHLGGTPLPDRRHPGADPRAQGRPLHGEALLPTARLTVR
jgi:hypothetical protein